MLREKKIKSKMNLCKKIEWAKSCHNDIALTTSHNCVVSCVLCISFIFSFNFLLPVKFLLHNFFFFWCSLTAKTLFVVEFLLFLLRYGNLNMSLRAHSFQFISNMMNMVSFFSLLLLLPFCLWHFIIVVFIKGFFINFISRNH